MLIKDEKTAKDYLKQGQCFYKFRLVLGRVKAEKVEFVGFVINKDERSIPIFYDGDNYTQIKYFWRDFVLCESYPNEGWFESEDLCITEGKKFFIERIVA